MKKLVVKKEKEIVRFGVENIELEIFWGLSCNDLVVSRVSMCERGLMS